MVHTKIISCYNKRIKRAWDEVRGRIPEELGPNIHSLEGVSQLELELFVF